MHEGSPPFRQAQGPEPGRRARGRLFQRNNCGSARRPGAPIFTTKTQRHKATNHNHPSDLGALGALVVRSLGFLLHPRNPRFNSVALENIDHGTRGSHGFQFQSFRFHDFKVSLSAPLLEKWIDPTPEASRRDAESQRFGTQRAHVELRKASPIRPIILTEGNGESPPSCVPLPSLVPWWLIPQSSSHHKDTKAQSDESSRSTTLPPTLVPWWFDPSDLFPPSAQSV
jgi:hypothetical protein